MHEIQFHINMHIFYVEFVLCIVVALTTLDPMSLGAMLYLICFRYTPDVLKACLIYKEGAITMCLLEPSSDDCELLSSTSPMLSW